MRQSQTLDVAYFDDLYNASPDPWGFADSAYEAAKYAHTIEALGAERASRALEVGCSIGVLTRRLAERCNELVATELARAPLQAARERCADLPHVTFRQVKSPADSFRGSFDLIVLSEVVYYWDDADLARVAAALEEALLPGGRVLLVHWLGETNYPKSADEALESLWALLPDMRVEMAERREKYRLDLWRRRHPPRAQTAFHRRWRGARTTATPCAKVRGRQEHGDRTLTAHESNSPDAAGRVILVEDDAIVRMISAELLRDLHYEVAEAASAEEAMAVLASQAADVLITDLNLPGMSGDDLAKAARRLSPHIRVIFASGDVSKAPAEEARLAYLLHKPYDVKDLAKAMAAVTNA